MSTLLDQNVHTIDFNSLDPIAELRKVNPRFMEIFDKLNANDRVLHMRSYPINSPVEEALVQYVLDKIAPTTLSQSEEARVRRAMAEDAAKGIEIDTPAKEMEWETKIQEARLKDKAHLDAVKAERAGQFGGNKVNQPAKSTGEGLATIKGLGAKSIEKLHSAGIKTADQFNSLTELQLREIVGPLVASKFRK